jgi:bifunctional non-homologous end joining protein LigD
MRVAEQLFAPFTSPDWIYELKFDGHRCMAGVEALTDEPLIRQMRKPGRRVRLLTTAGDDCTSWYPEIVRDLDLLPGGPHVIDAATANPPTTCRSRAAKRASAGAHRAH